MMKKLFVIVIVVVLGFGGYLIYKNIAGVYTTPTNVQTTNGDGSKSAAATITYTNDGFSPSDIAVHSGDSVMVKNDSNSTVQMESDPHPTHTDNTDLNVGEVAPGLTKLFVVSNKGSFGYHNHLNSSQTGKITVE